MSTISGVILAGGQSQRMGTNKAFLVAGGRPLIAWVMERVRVLTRDVILVTNDPEPYRILGGHITGDLLPEGGALSGLHAGLTTAAHGWSLVVACDMPLLNLDLLRYMISLTPYQDAVVPRLEGLEEPLHALYHRRCLRAITHHLLAGDYKMTSFLPEQRVRYLDEAEINRFDPQHLSFTNANTPEDWAEVNKHLRSIN
jgi:molybdopterin-guanine dinucleotide biosynthesis protein A